MIFPVVMYGSERWTIKSAEHRRIDTFELCCWRRLLRVPWRRSNQSLLKEISLNMHWKDWCWSWSFNTSAIWCEEPTHWRKTWWLGKIEGRRRRWQRMRWLDSLPDSMDINLSNSGRYWRTGKPGMLQFMGWQRVRHDLATEQQPQLCNLQWFSKWQRSG